MKKDVLAINLRLVSVNFEHTHHLELSVPILSPSLKLILEIVLAQLAKRITLYLKLETRQ